MEVSDKNTVSQELKEANKKLLEMRKAHQEQKNKQRPKGDDDESV